MDAQAPDIIDIQPLPTEELVERGEREITEMLMVDCVELGMIHQILDVWHLDHRYARVLQQGPDS